MISVSDSFGITMLGLETGLRVQHIAEFDLRSCSINDSTAAVLSDKSFADFDQIPVRNDAGRIVGVLNRGFQASGENIREAMQSLDESLLVSSEAPLMSFVRLAGTVPYKLVLNDSGIKGIVTRSDLLTLPVRLLAFAFITHLETVMASLIRKKCLRGEESWLELLSESRRKKVIQKRERLKGSRLELSMLEFTDFCDKRTIVSKISTLESSFCSETQNVEELRNQIAHAATFITTDSEAREFAIKIRNTEKWIHKLQDLIQQEGAA